MSIGPTNIDLDQYRQDLADVIDIANQVQEIADTLNTVSSLVSNSSDALSVAIAPLGGTPFVQAIAQFSGAMEQFSQLMSLYTQTVSRINSFDLERAIRSQDLRDIDLEKFGISL